MNPSDIDFDDLDGEADEGDGQPKGYVLKGFDSAIEAEGARYALRILRNARVYRRVFEHRSFAVDDTLALLGVRERPKRGKPGRTLSLRAALKCQARLLESRKPR